MNCAMRCLALGGRLLVPWPPPSRRLPPTRVWGAVTLQDPPVPGAGFHAGPVLGNGSPPPVPEPAAAHREGGAPAPARAPDELFERAASAAGRDRPTFERVLSSYCRQEARRRGHVEFIYAALRKMPEFGVERELDVYNRLLDVFPKEVFVARSYIQRMFNHFPRQQECAVQVLEQMENYGVLPDVRTKVLLVEIFGLKSHPMRKYQRLLYWFPRFRHANPFPVPDPLPRDPVELARLALLRMAPDLDGEVTVYQRPRLETGPDGRAVHVPHIVGLQSPEQRELLARHDPRRPVFVEGPFPLWLRRTSLLYYLLRSDPLPPGLQVTKPVAPERNFYYPLELTFDLDRDLGDDDELEVEEVPEGPVFALCQAGSGDAASLSRWVAGLQETNPSLSRTPVVFRTAGGAPRRPGPTPRLEPVPAEGGGEGEARHRDQDEEEPGARRMQR